MVLTPEVASAIEAAALAQTDESHDPAKFGGTAGRIDFDRPADAAPSLGFGHGARECLGYALAHAVLQPVIETLLALPNKPKLAPGYEPAFGANPYFRFLHHLPIVL